MSARRIDASLGIIAAAIEKAVALGVALYLPRHHLGLEDYGRYTFVLAHLGLFQALPDQALETALVARLAGNPQDARRLAGDGAVLRGLMSLLTGLLGLLVLRWVSDDPVVFRTGIGWCGALVATAANPFRALLRAQLAMGRYLALIAGQVSVALLCFAWVVQHDGTVPQIVVAIGTGNAFGLMLGRALAGGGVYPGRWTVVARQLIAVAAPLAVTGLVLLGAQQVVQIWLLRAHGVAAAGLVGGAQKLLDAVNVLAQAVMVTLLPALALAASESREAAIRIARRVLTQLLLILAPIAVMLMWWPEPALQALFGDRLLPAADIVRVSSVAIISFASGVVLMNLFVPLGQQRVLLLTTIVSAIVTIACGWAFVDAYAGVAVAGASLLGVVAGQMALLLYPTTRAATASVLRGAVGPLALAGLAALPIVGFGGGPLGYGLLYGLLVGSQLLIARQRHASA